MSLLSIRNCCANILKIRNHRAYERSFSVTSSLWLNQRFSRSSSYKEKEKYFLEKDRVPPNYELIYKAPMESYIAWATHVSTATVSLIGIAALYQFVLGKPMLDPVGTKLVMHSEDIYYFAAGFAAINAVLRLVVAKYPLRIYKNQKNYLAVYHSQLPSLLSHHHFEQGQVKNINYWLSPWNGVTYKLGDKPSLLLDDYFKSPSEFHEMRNDVKYKI